MMHRDLLGHLLSLHGHLLKVQVHLLSVQVQGHLLTGFALRARVW